MSGLAADLAHVRLLDAQSRDEKRDQVAGVVVRVAARPDAEIPDAAEQFVGIQAGADLAGGSGGLKELPAHWDQPVYEVGVQMMGLSGFAHRLTTPEAAIGLALLVLAWTERNRALLLLTVGYLAVVLLLGGIGFALARRPSRLAAA
jgi:hypothetical protein